ncbi:EamA family transporter RarD [Geopsychrobacter electrodiphilus]|uniref:EamA family transporter RarD n=1 Tax=Geopsychrobacter electrodiphilus TaxID=225196 RepID=UPI000365A70F|nr:EamA family transporter RarD [Geopsychrobacter electrodiphilus]
MADEEKTGVFFGLAAYLVWGFFPLYFKQVATVPATEVLGHRILWSALFLLGLVFLRRQQPELQRLLRQPRLLLQLTATTILIAINWLVFIYAVSAGHVLQSSLGYFIGPLVSALLGVTFLKERLNLLQSCSLLLATAGVIYLTLQQGELPWIALSLAFSFALYGLLRKQAGVGPILGLSIETLLLSPFALFFLYVLHFKGELCFGGGTILDLWLPLCGVVTALPLIWFNAAAKRLRLVTMGFLQYITPSMQFLSAVFLFNEPFDQGRLLGFCLVWSGLLLYSVNALRQASNRHGSTSIKIVPNLPAE